MRSMTVSLPSAIVMGLLFCAPVLAQFGGGGAPSEIQYYAPVGSQQARATWTITPQFTSGQMPLTIAAFVDQTYKIVWQLSQQQLAAISQTLRDRVSHGSWDGQKVYIRTLGTNPLVVRTSASVQRSIRSELAQILEEARLKQSTLASDATPQF